MTRLKALNPSVVIRQVRALGNSISNSTLSPRFGFVQGHSHLTKADLARLEGLVGVTSPAEVNDFEEAFSRLIGSGSCISFASGRMGAFSLMKYLEIGKGDEVILLGATCSVMVNAILKTGATPIYSDIDVDTFGSLGEHIESCISSSTRMIIAQHSFGIPCEISPIVELARSNNIFLLEDCALTLGSTINNQIVGTFGDAALFSTDHSKPLNTLIGGLVYSDNLSIINGLRQEQEKAGTLPDSHQWSLWRRFRLESRYCRPDWFGRIEIAEVVAGWVTQLFDRPDAFLLGDSGSVSTGTYPYPARLPPFLAALGLIEVERWQEVLVQRKEFLKEALALVANGTLPVRLPRAYYDRHREIVPLRLAWSDPFGSRFRESSGPFRAPGWTWFTQPLVDTTEPLESYGYRQGMCPVSEEIGPTMINLPCNFPEEGLRVLSDFYSELRLG